MNRIEEITARHEAATPRTAEIVRVLKDAAEWANANPWESPLLLGDYLNNAADALESLQTQLAAERVKYAELQRYNVDCTKACDRQMVEILELREQSAQLSNARNELCQRCGRYREAHKGACDGCRWKKGAK